MNRWLYFGCGLSDSGHYLWDERWNMLRGHSDPVLTALRGLDGALAPQAVKTPYVVAFSRLGGYGYSALSWWDNSVDRRPGSCSTIFSPSMTMMPGETLEIARIRFDPVFRRLPAKGLEWMK